MKNKMTVYIGIFVLFLIAVGIGGFIIFNKRLTESRENKEREDMFSEQSIPTETTSSNRSVGALEQTFKLQVLSPSDKSTVTSPTITFRGNTVAGAEVFVNDKETTADAQGNFSVQLTLEEGDNPIMVVANDADGNVSEAEITVTYEVSE